MQPQPLVLRDIHQPPAPPWWPPAPGWWLIAAALIIVVAAAIWLWLRRRRRRARIAALFDEGVRNAATPAAQLAVMSELLRRAARRRDPAADKLQGRDWLVFLDGDSPHAVFSGGAGQVLAEGIYRRDIDAAEVAELRPLARSRYLQLMGGRA